MSSLPIAAECKALIEAAAAASSRVRGFVKSCCDARRGLLNLFSELCALGLALECLSLDATTTSEDISDELQQQILILLGHCGGNVESINEVFRGHEKARENAPAEWAWPGNDNTDVLCQFSKSYKCIILLSVGILQLCAIKNTDSNASDGASQRANVEASINEALHEINQLPMALSEAGLMKQILSIQSHLDSLTLYAKSITNGDIDPTVTVFTSPPVTSSVLNDHDSEKSASRSAMVSPGPSQPIQQSTSQIHPVRENEQPKNQKSSSPVHRFGPGPNAVTEVRVREIQSCPLELEDQKFVPVASRGAMEALWVPYGNRFIIFGLTFQNVMADIRSHKAKNEGFYSTNAKFFPNCTNRIFMAIKYRSASEGIMEIWQVSHDLSLPILVNTLHHLPTDASWDVGVRDGSEVLYLLRRKGPSEPLALCVTDPFTGECIETLDEVPEPNPVRPPFVKSSVTGRSVLLCKHTSSTIQLWTHTSRPIQSAYNFREVQAPHCPETQREISINDSAITLVTRMQVFFFDTTSLEVKFSVHDFSPAGNPNELIPSCCGSLILTGHAGSEEMKLWNWKTGEMVWKTTQHWMTEWKFSPDDKFLIGICGPRSKLFEITNCCKAKDLG